MKVIEAISWLRTKVNESYGGRIVIISTQQAGDPGEPRRVIGVSMDDSDSEVHLLVNYSPWNETVRASNMTVDALLARLVELPTRYESYHLVSGTWRELDEEHAARIDWPIEKVVAIMNGTYIAFIERRDFGSGSDG